jgi:hypothetical protein
MNTGRNEIIGIYSHVVSQVIFISTSGIAAGVTLMQTGVIEARSTTLILSFIFFTVSLILGVFGLTTLLGQADSGSPDIHKGIVRWPNLISIITFIIGVSCFTYSLSSHFFSEKKTNIESLSGVTPKNSKSEGLECKISSLNLEQKQLLSYFVEKAFPDASCGKDHPVKTLKKMKSRSKKSRDEEKTMPTKDSRKNLTNKVK